VTLHHLLLLDTGDNILLATRTLPAGAPVQIDGDLLTLGQDLLLGHKIARRDIETGEQIIKYGMPIGRATQPIPRGAHVHVHNLASAYTATHLVEPST
jgi:hypothetical protein